MNVWSVRWYRAFVSEQAPLAIEAYFVASLAEMSVELCFLIRKQQFRFFPVRSSDTGTHDPSFALTSYRMPPFSPTCPHFVYCTPFFPPRGIVP